MRYTVYSKLSCLCSLGRKEIGPKFELKSNEYVAVYEVDDRGIYTPVKPQNQLEPNWNLVD